MKPTVKIWNEDCIAAMADRVADDSVHLTVTSIPFEELFSYSGKVEDVGNNGSTIDIKAGRFALNLRFFVEQLYRVTAPGHNAAIHIQQLLAYKNQHGYSGRRDFRGAMVEVFTAATSAGAFTFHGEFVIPKDPQQMAQRLNLHSLQFKTGYARHAGNLAPAPNDYVLIFHKPGDAVTPVRCIQHKTNPDGWLPTDDWVREAHGIWHDINQYDVLQTQKDLRENDQEKHVCPLQLEVIRRLVRLYTNPVELQPDTLVMDPFMGVGSTAAVCVEQGRNCIGFELKESYHTAALENVDIARRRAEQGGRVEASLFEAEEVPA